MKFGLTAEEYKFIVDQVVLPLRPLGAQVWVYGSRARGDHSKFSDLDLMVESQTDLAGPIAVLKEKLENSNFPFKVDLVQFSEFADSYKPNYLRDRIHFEEPG